jgi:hydroxymethylglutaryl-CoA lyase
VQINDETLRDGLQIEATISVDEKLRLLDALVAAGLRRIVVGSFVRPDWTPQMAETPELVKRISPVEGVEYRAIALNARGVERMREFSPPLTIDSRPITHLHLDPVFLKRNTNRTPEEQEATWRSPIPAAAATATGLIEAAISVSAPWGSNFVGSISEDACFAALERQRDAWKGVGVKVVEVGFNDPMGCVVPSKVVDYIRRVKRDFPSVQTFHLHLHNTRGLALASAFAAITVLDAHDTLRIDCSVGGIGGCPNCGNGQATGMIPTEDLVQLLVSMGIETGVDISKLIDASALLSDVLGRRLDSKVSLAGPIPSGAGLYAADLPVIETYREARHFRLGSEAYAEQR